jgi:replicative DNA helicase
MSDLFQTIGQHLCDLEAERALIKLIFKDNKVLDQVGDLTADDFADPNLGAVFQLAVDKRADGHPVSLVTLRTELTGLRLEDSQSGIELVQGLSFGGALPEVGELATRVHDFAARRCGVNFAESLAHQFADERAKIQDTVSYGVRQLDEISSASRAHLRTAANIDEIFAELMDELQSEGSAVEITTGFRDLNEATDGGWQRGKTAYIGGRTSMGKTAFAVSSALRTALAGKNVLMFSLEMSKKDVVKRIISDLVWTKDFQIPFKRMRRGLLSQRELEIVAKAELKFSGMQSKMQFTIDDQVGLTATDIAARTRKRADELDKLGKTLDLVVVDYIGKIAASSRYKGNKTYETAEVSLALTELARKEHVPVVTLTQLNRENENRENKRGTLANIRDSDSIGHDADLVMIAYRPAYYLERQIEDENSPEEAQRLADLALCKNQFELQIAKNRHGECAAIKFFCDMGSNRFQDAAKPQQVSQLRAVS